VNRKLWFDLVGVSEVVEAVEVVGVVEVAVDCLLHTGSTKEEMADSSQTPDGAELSLRPQGRKSIGESHRAPPGGGGA